MKKILSLVLAVLMVLALAACGGKSDAPSVESGGVPQTQNEQSGSANENSPVVSAPKADSKLPQSYAEGYEFYYDIADEMDRLVNGIVEANNARLEEEYPDDYYSRSDYMILLYMPFISLDMAFTATLDDSSVASVESVYRMMGSEDAKVEKLSSGEYRISYTGSDWQDETNTYLVEELVSYSNGSIRYVQYVDGEIKALYEYVSLGNDRFAMQSRTNRAVLTYKDAIFCGFCYCSMIFSLRSPVIS